MNDASAALSDATFDAVVIGAGPAGSATAILLARAGWSVALIEKQVFPRRKVCGECVAASNLPLLEGLGLGDLLAREAGPELRTACLLRGNAAVAAPLPAAPHPRYGWGRALGRETLDLQLVAQARRAGVRVLQPCTVLAIAGVPGNWRLDLRTPGHAGARQLAARVAIAAHGSWETLPSGRARRRWRRSAADLFAFKANFRGAALDPGCLPVLALDGGYGGMVLGEGGVATVACCVRRDRLEALRSGAPGLRAGEIVEAWLRRECAGVAQALVQAQRVGPWLASGPIDPGIRVRPTDALLRVGNAAGEAHPILGEGISMALQSAGLLCSELLGPSSGGCPGDARWHAAVARRYAAQWRRQFAPRLRLAAVFAHLAMRPVTSGLLMALTRRWPGVLTLGARWGGKARCATDPHAYRPRGDTAGDTRGDAPGVTPRNAPLAVDTR
jgi:flavin-dependent dehydrogenase